MFQPRKHSFLKFLRDNFLLDHSVFFLTVDCVIQGPSPNGKGMFRSFLDGHPANVGVSSPGDASKSEPEYFPEARLTMPCWNWLRKFGIKEELSRLHWLSFHQLSAKHSAVFTVTSPKP